MSPINNIESYTYGMSKSMQDKLLFWSNVDYDILVDYGCADGTMIESLHKANPNAYYLGYDISQEMLDRAEFRLKDYNMGVFLTTQWENIMNRVSKMEGTKVLVLSSIIHEVYNYCDDAGIKEFWERINKANFDYIVVRDMMAYQEAASKVLAPSIIEDIRIKYSSTALGRKQWGDFSAIYPIISMLDIVHLISKNSYVDNWEREVQEDYYITSINEVLMKFKESRYLPVFFNHYTLPYLKESAASKFNINIDIPTHVQIILKKM